MKNDLLATVKESLARAEEILEKRRADTEKSEAAKKEISDKLAGLKLRRTFAAEADDEALYNQLSKLIEETLDKLQYAEIRTTALKNAADPETGNKEYQKIKSAFSQYEKDALAELIRLAEAYAEKAAALNEAGQVAAYAAGRWKKVAGISDVDLSAYWIDRAKLDLNAVSPERLARWKAYLGQ